MRNGWRLKIEALIFAIIWIPLGIAYMLQIHNVINIPALENMLSPDCRIERMKTNDISDDVIDVYVSQDIVVE